jgi:hypothetical protein
MTNRDSVALSMACADLDAARKEIERLHEVMRREVNAAEQRGYAAGYSDGLTDMSNRYDPNAVRP